MSVFFWFFMLERYLRPLFQRFCIDFLANALKSCSPTLVTALATLLGLLAATLIPFHHPLLALLFLALSGLCDVLDGALARLQGSSSPIGTVCDILSDRLVESAVVIGLYFYAPQVRGTLALFMLASILVCVTSFLVVGIFSENASEKSFHYSPGLIERAEAFVFFGGMILFPTYFTPLAALFVALVLLTALIRVVQFYAVCAHSSSRSGR